MVTFPEQIEKVLVSMSEVYIGPPTKYTRTYENAGEVGERARVSSMKM